MKRALRTVGFGLLLGIAVSAGTAVNGRADDLPKNTVVRLRIEGVIDPVTARYLDRGLAQAEAQNAALVVIALDTPGGLDRSLRRMTERLLAAQVPVVAYVAPAGARAASAGAFIALAAPLAAMSPGTNIGAAHPVDRQGAAASEKITNDSAAYLVGLARLHGRPETWADQAVRASISTPAADALKMGVVDILAVDEADLLRQLDGREVVVNGKPRRLALRGLTATEVPMAAGEKLLHLLADPNIAYILFLVGIYGLIYELAVPGAILPGVAGAIAIVLALLGFESLPIALAGLLLLGLGGGLLILELFVISHGILAAGGMTALVLGSLIVLPGSVPAFRIAASVMTGMLAATAAFIGMILWVLIRGRGARAISGLESLPGERGPVTALTPSGALVRVRGEDWLADAETGALAVGQTVEVVSVTGLRLTVRAVEPR